jgi:hypothetical protein
MPIDFATLKPYAAMMIDCEACHHDAGFHLNDFEGDCPCHFEKKVIVKGEKYSRSCGCAKMVWPDELPADFPKENFI